MHEQWMWIIIHALFMRCFGPDQFCPNPNG
jgi:hypothetical protein